MKYKKFKNLDLFIFTFLVVISEIGSNLLSDHLNVSFYFSFATLLIIIFSIRWGRLAIIPSIFYGIVGMVYQYLFNEIPLLESILFYGIGNLSICVPILFIGKKRSKISEKQSLLIIYAITTLISMVIAKGLILFILNNDAAGFRKVLASMLFIYVINCLLLICFTFKGKSDLICNMDEYLIKINETDVKYENEYLDKIKKESGDLANGKLNEKV